MAGESIKPASSSSINRPTTFLDYYFSEAIDARGGQSILNTMDNNKVTPSNKVESNVRVYEHATQSSPVIALQADDDKLIVAYDNGVISCYDIDSGYSMFDLKGRSNLVSSLQFDETRLLADGTDSIVVVHDFQDTQNSDADLQYELRNNDDDDDYDDDDSSDDDGSDGDNYDRPSATS